MTFQSQRGHAFCSTKKIKFNKNEMELKMENPTQVFRETNLVFQLQLIQESQIKRQTVMHWSSRKKRAFFVSFILSKWKFFKICVLSQYIVY